MSHSVLNTAHSGRLSKTIHLCRLAAIHQETSCGQQSQSPQIPETSSCTAPPHSAPSGHHMLQKPYTSLWQHRQSPVALAGSNTRSSAVEKLGEELGGWDVYQRRLGGIGNLGSSCGLRLRVWGLGYFMWRDRDNVYARVVP